jgi:hypothetical protein
MLYDLPIKNCDLSIAPLNSPRVGVDVLGQEHTTPAVSMAWELY